MTISVDVLWNVLGRILDVALQPDIESYSQRLFSWNEADHPREASPHEGRLPGQFAPKQSGQTVIDAPLRPTRPLQRVTPPAGPPRVHPLGNTPPKNVPQIPAGSDNDSKERRNDLVDQNQDLIWKAVRTVMKDWHNVGRDIEEAESVANEALFHAASKFDFENGRPFASYAMEGMIQAIRNAFAKKRRGISGRTVSAAGMDGEVEQSRGIEQNPADLSIRSEHLQYLLDKLDDDERRLILAHTNPESGKTLSEIGEQFGMSRQTFMNHVSRVAEKLRTEMKRSLKDSELVPEKYQRSMEFIRTLDRRYVQTIAGEYLANYVARHRTQSLHQGCRR
ncbi:MAG: sigma-70 family RNA polymerase sigma factor [Planctomyces sp.]|nr:sigma-70 family RNA polymerase sigma factor [Planctomyces sp.]